MKRKQHRWLLLLLVGVMSLGFAACKKASEVPLDPDHIVLDDYEIWYKGFDVTPDADGQSALVLTLDFTNNGKEATSYLWAVSEKVFLDGIGLNTATVLQDGNSKGTVAETQLTEIMPGKTIEVKSAPENCPVTTMGFPQYGHADAAMLSSPTISPPQDWH